MSQLLKLSQRQRSFVELRSKSVLLMLRGVRVVEGADLERLCGVTHRGFESLPLSHTYLPETYKFNPLTTNPSFFIVY